MASGKTIGTRPISYNGQTLNSAPAPVAMPLAKPGMMNNVAGVGGLPGFSISDAINTAQKGQTAANAANNTRYNQGLGVLTGGANNSRGMIQAALADTQNLGATEKANIARAESQSHASTLQGAINRGIGNTSIVNSLQNGVTRTADAARTGVDDMVARNRSAINLQGAQNENSTAGSIAGFIGARNDVAPSLSEYAGLVQQAAQYNNGPKSTATVMGGGGINAAKPPSIQAPPVNQGAQIGQYFAKGGAGTSTFSDSSPSAGQRVGNDAGTYAPINPAPLTMNNGVISNALQPKGNGATALPDQPEWMTDEQYQQMLDMMGGY